MKEALYNTQIGPQTPGTKIKKSWNWARSLTVRSSDQVPEGYRSCSLTVRLQFCRKTFGFQPFFTQKPKFWSPNTQIRFQRLFTGSYTQKGFQKHIKHEIRYHFNTIHQINPFPQNYQQQLKSITNPWLWTPKLWIINNNIS